MNLSICEAAPDNNPGHWEPGMRVLVITAALEEQKAVLHGLQGDRRFDVLAAGIGPAAAAARTAKVLAAAGYGLVVSAGIAGGFSGKTEVGSLVVASEIIAADLGVETPEGFSSLDDLGLGSTRIRVDDGLVNSVTEALLAAGLPVKTGPVVTVSTATGTAKTTAELVARVPGAMAEAMEGYGVALAALDCGVPVIEIRAISNMVGPRDRAAWRVEEALDVLGAAMTVLLEVL